MRHVGVIESLGLAERQLGAVDDAGVIELVEVDGLVAAENPGDQAEVGAVAGGKDDARLLAKELGKGGFELFVQVE